MNTNTAEKVTVTAAARAARKTERVVKVVRSARKLMGEVGYVRTSMETIAKRSELSVGGLYLDFRSKEDLVTTAMLESLDEALAGVVPGGLVDAVASWASADQTMAVVLVRCADPAWRKKFGDQATGRLAVVMESYPREEWQAALGKVCAVLMAEVLQ
jgi:AcrR family transcriptional regulator